MKLINKNELSDLTTFSGGKFEVDSIESAYTFCEKITTKHYENFPVGSILIPKKYRKHFYSVYAFARIADDIADESDENPSKRISYLDELSVLLNQMEVRNNKFNLSDIEFSNPILLAVAQTMKEREIPAKPFNKLLIAFKRDIDFVQPKDLIELEDYCQYSANPIGELVLRIFGLYNDSTKPYSDAICTGLQLVNFWQDLSVDLKNGRCYIPQNTLQKHSITKENLELIENKVKLSECLNEIYNYTFSFFDRGKNLVKYLKYYRLKVEIKATIAGGEKMLKGIVKLGNNIIFERPQHSKSDFIKILIRSLC